MDGLSSYKYDDWVMRQTYTQAFARPTIRAIELRTIYTRVKDFLSWVTECQKIAASNEQGNDYEHIQVLQRDFNKFVIRTVATGSHWLWSLCDQCDCLVSLGHQESYKLTLWRDEIKEAWENVLEMIDTRMQQLAADYSCHVFMHNCRNTLTALVEKIQRWSSLMTRSGDFISWEVNLLNNKDLMRAEIAGVRNMVKNVRKEYRLLSGLYSGEKFLEIQTRAKDIESCWRHLKDVIYNARRVPSVATDDLAVFLGGYAYLRRSMDDMEEKLMQDIGSNKSVGQTMNSHHSSRKATGQQLDHCNTFGNMLISQGHFASLEVENKLRTLNNNWLKLTRLWEQGIRVTQVENSFKSLNGLDRVTPAESYKSKEEAAVYATVVPRSSRQRKDPDDSSNFFSGIHSSAPNTLFRQNPVKEQTLMNGTIAHSGKAKNKEGTTEYRGVLFRKRLRNPNGRSFLEDGGWKRLYCVLKDKRLVFYSRAQKKEQNKISKRYPPLLVTGAKVKGKVMYRGLDHVFSVQIPNEHEHLFQANDDHQMNQWVHYISHASQR